MFGHSGEQSDFFLTCKGSGDDASKFNFLEAQAYVGTPPETSMLILKPLAPNNGGIVHTGGAFFPDKTEFSRTYVIRFDRAEAEAAGFAGPRSGRLLLRVASPMARVEPVWQSK